MITVILALLFPIILFSHDSCNEEGGLFKLRIHKQLHDAYFEKELVYRRESPEKEYWRSKREEQANIIKQLTSGEQ